jgi:hypothetical protein
MLLVRALAVMAALAAALLLFRHPVLEITAQRAQMRP